MLSPIAFLPLSTYPEPVTEDAILAAARYATALGHALQVRAYNVTIPNMYSPLGGMLIDAAGLARSAEEKSVAEGKRLKDLLEGPDGLNTSIQFSTRKVVLGAAFDAAATDARYCDLSVLPWSAGTTSAQEMSEAVVFGSGRPAIIVPASALPARPDHIAIAWDESRVAARALGDALSLLPQGGRVSVLTVKDEKPLTGHDVAASLAAALERRGFKAKACSLSLGGKSIAEALQQTAIAEGAQLLAMGGFGHSRFRDFVLGGATQGVLTNLHLPVLLSH